jgi:hypothetical protein
MRCTNCNADNPANASFCSQCGRSLVQWTSTSTSGGPPVAAGGESAFMLTAKPWTPIASPEQAKTLTTIGVVSLGIAAALALVGSTIIGFFGVVVAVIYAACAAGTRYDSRAAAGIGLGWYVLNVLSSLVGSPGTIVFVVIWLPLGLGILAGLRGTIKTSEMGGRMKPISTS